MVGGGRFEQPKAQGHPPLPHTHLILIEEHLQLPHADPEVSLVELVGDVPAEGTELPPLLDQSVEEAEAKEELLPLTLYGVGEREGGREGGGEREEGERKQRKAIG